MTEDHGHYHINDDRHQLKQPELITAIATYEGRPLVTGWDVMRLLAEDPGAELVVKDKAAYQLEMSRVYQIVVDYDSG